MFCLFFSTNQNVKLDITARGIWPRQQYQLVILQNYQARVNALSNNYRNSKEVSKEDFQLQNSPIFNNLPIILDQLF